MKNKQKQKYLANLTIFVRITNEWGGGKRANLSNFAKPTLYPKI